MFPPAIAFALVLAQAAGGPPSNIEPLRSQAIRATSQCLESGGAEHFAPLNGVVIPSPSGLVVPAGATVTFWRIPTKQGVLFAYSGYEGRTDFCGVVASGVGLGELGDELARQLATYDGWVSAAPPGSDWMTTSVQSDRYWGDALNTSLCGAELSITRLAGSEMTLHIHYHRTKVL